MGELKKGLELFRGNGCKNEDGMTLEAFLEDYNPDLFEHPSCTVDMVVIAYEQGLENLEILMIQRRNHPSIGWWALPGGFVEMDEELYTSAKRELEEETGIHDMEMIQLKTYGRVNRDPRTRVITTACLALVPKENLRVQAGDDASDAAWFQLNCECIEKQGITCTYRVKLRNDEKKIDLETDVRHVCTECGYLTNQETEVLKSDKIASDHGAIIYDALKYIETNVKK